MIKSHYTKSLFIFRRDLRIEDNIGLINASKHSDIVIPCFILDPRQLGNTNKFRSANAINFMGESLIDLDHQLTVQSGRLYLFEGTAEDVVEKLLANASLQAVFTNRDYTPFSIKRDAAIKKACDNAHVAFHQSEDLLLTDPDTVKTKKNGFYTIFTPFYRTASQMPIAKPATLTIKNLSTKKLPGELPLTKLAMLKDANLPTKTISGGSKAAHKIIKSLKSFNDYGTQRDFPLINTTRLSAHLKFGTVSVRTAFYAIKDLLGDTSPLLRQLYWRDFWTYIGYHWPHVYGSSFHPAYNQLPWNNNHMFEKWCSGTTGFPIVDAGIRELNTSGFMHGRVRMIVASFLTKDLHIDWRKGERYFAQQLTDYDPAVNNGNWQWSASTGCDAQPYFRIFNPWLQQKKFDAECLYIKKWIPELAMVSNAAIHAWHNPKKRVGNSSYPAPIVDHAIESPIAKKLYASILKKS